MTDNKETVETHFVKKHYNCKVCGKSHEVRLDRSFSEGRSNFPFPYVHLHSEVVDDELKEFMVILYIDRDMQVRSAQPLIDNEDFFSKDQMIDITSKLMNEIERLRKENAKLTQKINKLKQK
ncbi:MAG: hypothetical protein ACOC44_05180 [Promethearchaeia archaeon]